MVDSSSNVLSLSDHCTAVKVDVWIVQQQLALTFMPLNRPGGWFGVLLRYQIPVSARSVLPGLVKRSAVVTGLPVRGSVGAVLVMYPLTAAGVARPTSAARLTKLAFPAFACFAQTHSLLSNSRLYGSGVGLMLLTSKILDPG